MLQEGRRYRVLGVLGRGGFGTVFRADLLGEGSFVRPVALKVLNPEMEGVATVAARLRDEARLLGRVRHRSIVQVDGLVRLDDRWTVVMEYVDGVDLGRVIEAGAVPARAAAEIVGEAAGALHVVQTWPGDDGRPLGMLHRDIKPGNLLLTAVGEVKVLDFGVARAELPEREAQTRGLRFGSPGYVAPERLDGEERPAGDVYSLGVVFFELLTGARMGRPSIRKDRHEPFMVSALERLAALVPGEVHSLVKGMLAYDPDERPSAREVERRCRELVARLDGPFLRDWAELAVPPLLSARELGDAQDEFSSDIVAERSGNTGGHAATTSLHELDDPDEPVLGLSVLEAPIHAPVMEPVPLPRPQGRSFWGILADLSLVTTMALATVSVLALASLLGCVLVCMGV